MVVFSHSSLDTFLFVLFKSNVNSFFNLILFLIEFYFFFLKFNCYNKLLEDLIIGFFFLQGFRSNNID